MTSKHKVSAATLVQSWSFVILRIEIFSGFDAQVIGGEEVDPKAVGAVFCQEIACPISVWS